MASGSEHLETSVSDTEALREITVTFSFLVHSFCKSNLLECHVFRYVYQKNSDLCPHTYSVESSNIICILLSLPVKRVNNIQINWGLLDVKPRFVSQARHQNEMWKKIFLRRFWLSRLLTKLTCPEKVSQKKSTLNYRSCHSLIKLTHIS